MKKLIIVLFTVGALSLTGCNANNGPQNTTPNNGNGSQAQPAQSWDWDDDDDDDDWWDSDKKKKKSSSSSSQKKSGSGFKSSSSKKK